MPGARASNTTSYFLGNDPKHWISGIQNETEVVYHEIYPGIALVFHGRDRQLEQDFRVAAGSDPSRISFSFEGADIALDHAGNLRVNVGSAKLMLRKAVACQETSSGRREVEVGFVIQPDHSVGFRIGAYDSKQELIIDPVFSFSTFLIGTGNSSIVAAATTDAAGNIYVTGFAGTGFPIVNGVQPTLNGTQNTFVSKFDPTGHTLLYSTYLGGAGVFGDAFNYSSAIALDPNGNIIIAGDSSANDFPHAGSVPTTNCQTNHLCFFVASLSSDGSSLNYSGLIGGGKTQSDTDYGNNGKLAIDAAGNAYLTGVTDDASF